MSTEDARKLFIAGLPDTISEDVLRQLFEATGATVVDVSVPRDRASGKSRGFAFVTMATVEQAEAAREALDNSTQAGRVISVRSFQSEAPKRPEQARQSSGVTSDRTLYVGNLPFDCTEDKLQGFCESLGIEGITRINLPTGADGRRRGFGFVCMESSESADAALAKLQAAEINGRKLIVNIAHGKSERPPRTERFEPSRPPSSPRTSSAVLEPQEYDFMPMPTGVDVPRRTHDERKRPRVEAEKARGEGRPKPKERRRSGRRRGGYAEDFDDDD